MIGARIERQSARLAENLARKAASLATAHAEARRRTARADPLRWRMARLLWPLFTKG